MTVAVEVKFPWAMLVNRIVKTPRCRDSLSVEMVVLNDTRFPWCIHKSIVVFVVQVKVTTSVSPGGTHCTAGVSTAIYNKIRLKLQLHYSAVHAACMYNLLSPRQPKIRNATKKKR